MKEFTAALTAVAALVLSGIASAKISTPVTVKGNAFFTGNDRVSASQLESFVVICADYRGQFYIRGVDYQPGGSSNTADPLANATNCKRDISFMKDLGLNTIRVCSCPLPP
jgi:hypothetical protein